MFLSNLLKNNDITTIKYRLNANKTDEMLILILKIISFLSRLSDNIFILVINTAGDDDVKQEEIDWSVSQSKENFAAVFTVLNCYSVGKAENI